MGNKQKIEELERKVKELEEDIKDLKELIIADANLLHLVYKKLLIYEENTYKLEKFYDKLREEATKKIERKSQ